jgi:hypothetical protein
VRHVRMLGLCLVAALAVGAYATSSAMAGPQWVQCKSASELEALKFPFEAKQIKYTDTNCTSKQPKEARAYVLLKAPEVENLRLNYLGKESANVPFSGGSVEGGGVLTTVFGECTGGTYEERRVTKKQCEEGGGEVYYFEEFELFVECESEANTGEAEGNNKIANVHVTFKGCAALGVYPCTGEGEGLKEGEIETSTLKGKLGYPETEGGGKAKHEAAIVLEPAQKKGLFAQFNCPGIGNTISVGVGNKKEGTYYTPEGEPENYKHGGYDQIISPITPTNTMVGPGEPEEGFTQVYAIEEGFPFGNIPNKLEGKHISALEDYLAVIEKPEYSTVWVPAGEEITNVNTPEEAGEIKA